MIRSINSTAILTVSVLLAALVAPDMLRAQQPPPVWSRSQIGIYGAFQLVQHNAELAGIPGVPTCCVGFDGGSGGGFAIGALYEMPLARQIALQLRAGYSLMGGSMTVTEVIGNALENGQVVDATVEHSLEPTLGLLSVEPMVSWYPFRFPLSVNVGLQGSLFMAKSYDQRETLIEPTSATFTNGQAVRNASTGDIEQTKPVDRFYMAGILGLAYDIPVSPDITISPEVAYHYNVTPILEDSSWNAHALRLGVSVRMGLGSPDPTQGPGGERAALMAMVRATGLFADSSEQPIVQIRVEEFLSAQLRPLLNYVFFDGRSDGIPARYNALTPEQARSFSIENLHYLDAMKTYHHLLNIIGRRMQEHPTATLRLVGTNSDEGAEKGNMDLSQNRAEAVRDYLQGVWGVPANRITVESRGLPEKPSNVNEDDGMEENRRVEIYSDNPRILEPVLTTGASRSTATTRGFWSRC
jgi:hypothetical protein